MNVLKKRKTDSFHMETGEPTYAWNIDDIALKVNEIINTKINIVEPTAVYTYQEVMQILSIKSKTTMGKILKRGLKPVHLGKEYRFLGEEILRWLRKNESIKE